LRDICGTAFNNPGTVGLSINGSAIFGQSPFGLAGEFIGDVSASGNLSKAAHSRFTTPSAQRTSISITHSSSRLI
jgi:hypothetical protein